MPEKETLRRAAKDRREGKAPSTQAGEFIREEIHHVREGKGASGNKWLHRGRRCAPRPRRDDDE
jgi:hypothetical protein